MVAHHSLPGSTVTLYRAGSGGYGSAASALGTAQTDARGLWTITFPLPPDDPLIYVLADGGTSAGANNSAIALLAALGPLHTVPNEIVIDEATTVASVYSLARFLDTNVRNIGAPDSNITGLTNAFRTVRNLVDLTVGEPILTADPFTPLLNPDTQASEAPPARVIDTLVEILAACTETGSASSAGCTSLMGLTTPPGGRTPADTRQAAHQIVLNPGNNVTALFNLSRTPVVLYPPDLGATPPNDWTLAINFVGGALAGTVPAGIAFDSAGDAWITGQRCNALITSSLGCIIELRPAGSQVGPFPSSPQGMKVDLHGGTAGAITIGVDPISHKEIVWVAGDLSNELYALNAADGSFLFGGNFTAGGLLRRPQALAADPLGNIWVINRLPGVLPDGSNFTRLFKVSPGAADDYSAVSEFDYPIPAGSLAPQFSSLALDGSVPANIWATNAPGSEIVEFNGSTLGQPGSTQSFVSPTMSFPVALAADPAGNIWAADKDMGVSEVTKTNGGYVLRDETDNTVFDPGFPGGIAVDGSGLVWIANTDQSAQKGVVVLGPTGSVSGLTALGSYNGASPASGGPFGFPNVGTSPLGVAIDRSGNVWVTTGEAGGVVELVGAAVPVRTPLNGPPALP